MQEEMNTKNTLIQFISIAMLTSSLFSNDFLPKRSLLSNGEKIYNELPPHVNNLSEMLSEGKIYGRLRSNTFYFKWKDEDSSKENHLVSGLGASLVFKSATFNDFDFTAGLYYSQAFFSDTYAQIDAFKPGKDTLSRFNYVNSGDKSLAVLGQANISYKGLRDTEIILGRQLIETFYTRSNDTKMVPNTFDGISINTNALADTSLTLAYLYEQKLRDHDTAHSVLMYGDSASSSSIKPQWSENDDSAMHRGLTYTALKAAGKPTDAPLIVGDVENTSVENLKVSSAFYIVPELISQIMGELNYTYKLSHKLSLTPGFRYLKQFDNGAGSVGGASYSGDTTGYKDPSSLESQMIAARLVAKIDIYKINLAYSNIFDEADLVTPWRGFPTSGYTRSMARYNWRANTSSYRIEMQRNSNATGVYKDMLIQASLLYTDADESKIGAHVLDELYYYVGFTQNVPSLDNLQWKLRLGYTQYLQEEASRFSNLDSRFELNYLF